MRCLRCQRLAWQLVTSFAHRSSRCTSPHSVVRQPHCRRLHPPADRLFRCVADSLAASSEQSRAVAAKCEKLELEADELRRAYDAHVKQSKGVAIQVRCLAFPYHRLDLTRQSSSRRSAPSWSGRSDGIGMRRMGSGSAASLCSESAFRFTRCDKQRPVSSEVASKDVRIGVRRSGRKGLPSGKSVCACAQTPVHEKVRVFCFPLMKHAV